MTTPDTPKAPPNLTWNEGMRSAWREVNSHRNRKDFHLGVAFAPYIVCPLIALMGLGGHGSDAGVIVAVGGGLFLIFVLFSPLWLVALLMEWKVARDKFKAARRAFWERYGVDPVSVFPPPLPEPPKAPWE